jgi:hypothetical protein
VSELTSAERAGFVRDGIIIKRNAVAAELVARARARIDSWYQAAFDPAKIQGYTQTTFAPELGIHPDLLTLYASSSLAAAARALTGADLSPVRTVQVQIRLPNSAPQPSKAMHVDGVSCPHLEPAELRTFTLLVGVLLSDVPDATHGALHYVPGGHLAMAQWFQNSWDRSISAQTPPEIDRQHGTPVLGRAGDAFLMHHLVPHAVGENIHTEPRVVLYYRVQHSGHARQALAALKNPWLEYPALTEYT